MLRRNTPHVRQRNRLQSLHLAAKVVVRQAVVDQVDEAAQHLTRRLEAGREAADQSQAQFSPDGAWVAYTSAESGRLEVYVQSFPATGAKWQVSTTGGEQPRWRRDGKELFYLAPDRHVMAVAIKAPAAFDAEEPRRLFATPNSPVGDINVSQSYDVMPGGTMFLIAAADPGSPQSPLTVITR